MIQHECFVVRVIRKPYGQDDQYLLWFLEAALRQPGRVAILGVCELEVALAITGVLEEVAVVASLLLGLRVTGIGLLPMLSP